MTKTTQANRLEVLNREIELLTPAAIQFMNLKVELTAKNLTGVQQQVADRAALYCELVATRTRIEG